ncbi:MAG TPA: TetR/AcrR family transcriptional regulator C-terminal domain-containing protein [Solirubrobacterales bacterium]|jgi:AcrR family transcriptional regulator
MPVERPAASASAPATSRQEVVEAAVKLADEEGIEAVSMRRLAERLGVGTMTPYTYVESKEELLDLMRDEVARAMLVPEPLPRDWREALRQIALRTRAALEAHPWAASARPHGLRVRINLARHIEQSASVVETLGVDPKVGAAALAAVDDYVIGHCLRLRARQRVLRARRAAVAAGQPPGPVIDPAVEAAIESGELARVGRIFAARAESGRLAVAPASDFEQGLEWLLDGIERATRQGVYEWLLDGAEADPDEGTAEVADGLAERSEPR